VRDCNVNINLDDEIIRETLVAQQGKVAHARIAEMMGEQAVRI